jgi:hypothetical protein
MDGIVTRHASSIITPHETRNPFRMSTLAKIALRRLGNQFLAAPHRSTPGEIVAALGAVQAQDYAGAKWAVALRGARLTDTAVEQAFTDGSIVRTHVMRPTWHFVAPADLRWLLELTAPRVHAISAHRYRELELTDAVFRKSHAVMTKALQGGSRHLTRKELGDVLQRARIDTTMPQRLAYLLMRAELDAVICSGPRRGKQFTYALLDERVSPGATLERDEALRALVLRYFATRGPATPQDFSWWSGLTVSDAKRGIQAAGSSLESITVDGTVYWSGDSGRWKRIAAPMAHLLPNYDEFFIGFRDRSAIGLAVRASGIPGPVNALTQHVILVDAQLVGGWKRTLATRAVTVELTSVVRLTPDQRAAVFAAARRFGDFLELPVEIAWRS